MSSEESDDAQASEWGNATGMKENIDPKTIVAVEKG